MDARDGLRRTRPAFRRRWGRWRFVRFGLTIDAVAGADAFTSARPTPGLSVSRVEHETDAHASGSSRELAGRGLNGDYALFFPAEGGWRWVAQK